MSEGTHHNQVARYELKQISYKNETTFTFKNYTTKLNGIFNVRKKCGFPIYEKYKVEHLIDNITCPNKYLKTEVSIFKSSGSSTFVKALTYVSTVFAIIYPLNNLISENRRRGSIYDTGR